MIDDIPLEKLFPLGSFFYISITASFTWRGKMGHSYDWLDLHLTTTNHIDPRN